MYYESELKFFKKLVKNLHLQFNVFDGSNEKIPEFDYGIRRLIYNESDYRKLFSVPAHADKENTIYRIQDEFFCKYICFQLPDKDPHVSHILIGPYANQDISKAALLQLADRFSLSPAQFNQLEKYYSDLPFIVDEESLFALVDTFGEYLWGSMDNFVVETVEKHMPDHVVPVASRPDSNEPEDAFVTMNILEKRYEYENQLIHAISQGLLQKAELAMKSSSILTVEQRVPDPVRNIKNYCIIMNTLLRKGAEQGSVHPLHIDSLSSKFARKIEQLTTVEGGLSLQKEMVHKYCLLVKNHSMKGYSLLVQKVITRIDSDLTADLSLKTQADYLNVNASYLSTLFKKETGVTLTDYVNKRRVDYAVFLLNTTNMQIQNIAQYCGIPDVNYFTKIFKKYIGKTPKEYRGEIL